MYEAMFMVIALALVQWYRTPWSLVLAVVTLAVCLPGLLVMRGGAPFVSTPRKILDAMLELAGIRPGDKVADLGCGDGRLVFAAAAKGADATGYEFSVPTYTVAKLRSLTRSNARIRYANFWKLDHSDADIVFCFLLQDTMQDFKRKIWPTLKPGAKVVSHAFSMEGIAHKKKLGGALLYIKK